MKSILIVIIATLLTFSGFGQANNIAKYSLTIKKGRFEKKDSQIYLTVPTILTNNTSDTLKYFSMSCSWREFYYLDNENISFEPWLCTKNSPIMLTLDPFKNVNTEIKLVVGQTINPSNLEFRIGFNLLEIENIKELLELHSEYCQKKIKNIIWSNTYSSSEN